VDAVLEEEIRQLPSSCSKYGFAVEDFVEWALPRLLSLKAVKAAEMALLHLPTERRDDSSLMRLFKLKTVEIKMQGPLRFTATHLLEQVGLEQGQLLSTSKLDALAVKSVGLGLVREGATVGKISEVQWKISFSEETGIDLIISFVTEE